MATSLVPRHTVAFILLKLSRATLDLSGARDLVAFCFSISFFFFWHGRNVCAWAGRLEFDSAWEDYYISVDILLKKYERLFMGYDNLEMPFRDLFPLSHLCFIWS